MYFAALVLTSAFCHAASQPGAPVPISSAEAEEAAYEALLLYSISSQRTNALGLNRIADAQRQVVSGTKYILVLIAGETDCPVKTVQTANALKNCAVEGPLETYEVEIWDQAWRTPRFTLLKFDPMETAACPECRRQQTKPASDGTEVLAAPAMKLESPVPEDAEGPPSPRLTTAMYRVLAAAACLGAAGALILIRKRKRWALPLEDRQSANAAWQASDTKADYRSFSRLS